MATGNALKRGIYVVGAKRTAFGTFGGTLKGHSPTDLQVIMLIVLVNLLFERLYDFRTKFSLRYLKPVVRLRQMMV